MPEVGVVGVAVVGVNTHRSSLFSGTETNDKLQIHV